MQSAFASYMMAPANTSDDTKKKKDEKPVDGKAKPGDKKGSKAAEKKKCTGPCDPQAMPIWIIANSVIMIAGSVLLIYGPY